MSHTCLRADRAIEFGVGIHRTALKILGRVLDEARLKCASRAKRVNNTASGIRGDADVVTCLSLSNREVIA